MQRILPKEVLLCLVLTAGNALAQTGSGQVGGIVQDATKALIPGVTITLTNTATGVVTTQISNETGAYGFASVPPGTYKLTAELAGFRQAVANDLQVGTNAQVRWDFTLEVGALSSAIEVSVQADQLQTESTASVGLVLPEQRVRDLPVVGQNVLDLIKVLPGFRLGNTASTATVGGLGLDTVNATINGLSTNSSRDAAQFWGYQTFTTNVINPDLVGEVRLIIAPVDAELGRGNAQFQIQTRGGTNRYGGSAVLDIQNSALNANSWANNRTTAVVDGKTVWAPTRANWYNLQQYTGSFGGPIKKNKSFFFFLYDQQVNNARELITTQVLTDTARQGIFRYYSGWNPGNALEPFPTSFTNSTTASYPVVDFNGNPRAPLNNPDGSAYTGGLRCFSVFGNRKFDGSPFTAADCPGGSAVIRNTGWDQNRLTPDQTGYIQKVLGMMPKANFFATFANVNPDGLNTAIYRYVRRRTGSNSTNSSIGVVQTPADYPNRKQLNLKVDHNFTSKHRVSLVWTYEMVDSEASLAPWDGKLNGNIRRRPEILTVNGTSTLSPTLVNEARFGVNYSSEWFSPAWANLHNKETAAAARALLLTGGKNASNGKTYPVIYNPGAGANGFLQLPSTDFANTSPLWDYADTVRWMRGKHAFSMGGNYRRPMTTGFNSSAYATATTGNPTGVAAPLITTLTNFQTELPGFLQAARNSSANLLYLLYGSLATAATPYWIDGYNDVASGAWRDTTLVKDRIHTGEDQYGHQARTQISNEWSFFFKDDYKFTKRLTLNLGVRYDYNMSPYLRGGSAGGLTNRFVGDGAGLFGAGRPTSGDLFSNWLQPGNLYLTGYGSRAAAPLSCQKGVQQSPLLPVSTCDPDLMSTVEFVGPGSPNPDKTLVPQSGRLGPALGVAWQVPWFGDGKTTLRGGFQRTYGTAGSTFSGGLLSGPGGDGTNQAITITDSNIAAILATRALNLSDLPALIPSRPVRAPGVRIPIVGRSINVNYAMYDANYVTPYTDNFTLSISRTVRRNLTVDVRLVNTIGKKLPGTAGQFGTPGSFDINAPNVFHHPELFNAIERTRAGLDDPLFDQMLIGLNLNPTVTGYGPVGTTAAGVLQRGSAHIRRQFAANLANGNYSALITQILNFVPAAAGGGAQTLPIDPATGATVIASQRLLRNGCDRIANGLTTGFTIPGGTAITPRCFPENYFVANPQLGAANYAVNFGRTNYTSFETEVTLRPTLGMSVNGTYSFSKTMAQPGSGYTDPSNRRLDYGKASSSVGHEFRANGTVELPVGPNKLLLRSSSGWLSRLVEHWQTSFIFILPHGLPRSLSTANNFLYANGRPDVVGPWDNPKGQVTWHGQEGSYFGNPNPYVPFPDPQCAQRVGGTDANGFNLRASCTLRGLAQIVPSGTAGAVVLPDGRFGLPLLQNPQPGKQGTLGSNTMYTFGKWILDANVSKTFKISESKSIQIRLDATNVLNHPWPADPIGLGAQGTNFGSDNFGQILTKGGNVNNQPRQFQGKLRFTF